MKFLTLPVFLFCVISSNAQVSFPTDSAKWSLEQSGGDPYGDPCFFYIGWNLTSMGDSVINGNTYYLQGLTRTYYYTQNTISYSICSAINEDEFFGITGGYRLDSGKVYYYEIENGLSELFGAEFPDTVDVLLYDFNKNIGDTIEINGFGFYPQIEIINNIDTIILEDGLPRRRFEMLHGAGGGFEYRYIIEGIGDEHYGLFGPLQVQYFESGFWMNCYWEKNKYLLGSDSCDKAEFFMSVEEQLPLSKIITYPNPFNSELNITVSINQPLEIFIISMEGKILLQQSVQGNEIKINTSFLNPGIYILKIEAKNGEDHYCKIIKSDG